MLPPGAYEAADIVEVEDGGRRIVKNRFGHVAKDTASIPVEPTPVVPKIDDDTTPPDIMFAYPETDWTSGTWSSLIAQPHGVRYRIDKVDPPPKAIEPAGPFVLKRTISDPFGIKALGLSKPVEQALTDVVYEFSIEVDQAHRNLTKQGVDRYLDDGTTLLTVDERVALLCEVKGERGTKMWARYCVHCGRVYAETSDTSNDECTCGGELYPVSSPIKAGEQIEGADNVKIRTWGAGAAGEVKCADCGCCVPDVAGTGWVMNPKGEWRCYQCEHDSMVGIVPGSTAKVTNEVDDLRELLDLFEAPKATAAGDPKSLANRVRWLLAKVETALLTKLRNEGADTIALLDGAKVPTFDLDGNRLPLCERVHKLVVLEREALLAECDREHKRRSETTTRLHRRTQQAESDVARLKRSNERRAKDQLDTVRELFAAKDCRDKIDERGDVVRDLVEGGHPKCGKCLACLKAKLEDAAPFDPPGETSFVVDRMSFEVAGRMTPEAFDDTATKMPSFLWIKRTRGLCPGSTSTTIMKYRLAPPENGGEGEPGSLEGCTCGKCRKPVDTPADASQRCVRAYLVCPECKAPSVFPLTYRAHQWSDRLVAGSWKCETCGTLYAGGDAQGYAVQVPEQGAPFDDPQGIGCPVPSEVGQGNAEATEGFTPPKQPADPKPTKWDRAELFIDGDKVADLPDLQCEAYPGNAEASNDTDERHAEHCDKCGHTFDVHEPPTHCPACGLAFAQPGIEYPESQPEKGNAEATDDALRAINNAVDNETRSIANAHAKPYQGNAKAIDDEEPMTKEKAIGILANSIVATMSIATDKHTPDGDDPEPQPEPTPFEEPNGDEDPDGIPFTHGSGLCPTPFEEVPRSPSMDDYLKTPPDDEQ
jgi:uncharacterized Zn finger protein (UPF0148 family)